MERLEGCREGARGDVWGKDGVEFFGFSCVVVDDLLGSVVNHSFGEGVVLEILVDAMNFDFEDFVNTIGPCWDV